MIDHVLNAACVLVTVGLFVLLVMVAPGLAGLLAVLGLIGMGVYLVATSGRAA